MYKKFICIILIFIAILTTVSCKSEEATYIITGKVVKYNFPVVAISSKFDDEIDYHIILVNETVYEEGANTTFLKGSSVKFEVDSISDTNPKQTHALKVLSD